MGPNSERTSATPAADEQPFADGEGTGALPADPGEDGASASSGVPTGLSRPLHPPPGSAPRKRLGWRVDWELISCGFHGHVLVGTDAAELRPIDAFVARDDTPGWRWHRCLRCESWVRLQVPDQPVRRYPPDPLDIEVPAKGKRLRDRYVLRLIVVDRAFHFLVLASLAVAIFLFANHRSSLHADYIRILTALHGSAGGPTGASSFVVRDLNRLFAESTGRLYLVAGVIAAYAVLLAVECVGLWRARRWAEYLTFVETALLIPLEIYELTTTVTPLKVVALVINVAVVVYLGVAHRLFGLRGGKAAAMAEYGDEG